jgi:hypothetical protein
MDEQLSIENDDTFLLRVVFAVRKFPRAASEASAGLVATYRYQPQVYTRY